jgi:hypothetical protein
MMPCCSTEASANSLIFKLLAVIAAFSKLISQLLSWRPLLSLSIWSVNCSCENLKLKRISPRVVFAAFRLDNSSLSIAISCCMISTTVGVVASSCFNAAISRCMDSAVGDVARDCCGILIGSDIGSIAVDFGDGSILTVVFGAVVAVGSCAGDSRLSRANSRAYLLSSNEDSVLFIFMSDRLTPPGCEVVRAVSLNAVVILVVTLLGTASSSSRSVLKKFDVLIFYFVRYVNSLPAQYDGIEKK